jgi:hypothetical protein
MTEKDSTRPEQTSADQLALPEAIATGVKAVPVFAPLEFVNDIGGEQRLVTRAAGRVLALPRPDQTLSGFPLGRAPASNLSRIVSTSRVIIARGQG